MSAPSDRLMVWFLNRTDYLFHSENAKDEIRNALKEAFHPRQVTVEFGDRNRFNAPDVRIASGESVHQLMPGFKAQGAKTRGKSKPTASAKEVLFDEYFVPIPVKCLGPRNAAERKYWSPQLSDEDFHRAGMCTRDRLGYYSILEANPEYRHILIGYSQGGMVARYLAYHDSHVAKKNLIHGIITVASPNFGSPVANPRNRTTVVQGLVGTLGTLLSIPAAKYGDFYEQFNESLLQSILKGLRDVTENTPGGDENKDLFDTAYKWLSGLGGDPKTAFFELNPARLNVKGSVLYLVNHKPPNCYHGAVIDGNSDINQVLDERTQGHFGRKIILWIVRHWVKILKRTLFQNFQEGSDYYGKAIMRDDSTVPSFLKEKGDKLIPEFACDFVIPSRYQQLLPDHAGKFLGNHFNSEGNHLSSSEPNQKAGSITIGRVLQMLREMKPVESGKEKRK